MPDDHDRLSIGEFAELVGLSVPQLRHYDRLRLIEPAGRSDAGYRYYRSGQAGAGRVIALLRSMDMPLAEVRRILGGLADEDRRELLRSHRARLEARLEEVRDLLDAVDAMTNEDNMSADATTDLSTWLHLMPRLPVSDLERSIAYYQDALGLRLAWRTTNGDLAAIASGEIEFLLLTPWTGEGGPPAQSAYVFVEDPDALFAEYEAAGADIADPVASRPSGMRDFAVRDRDGHRLTFGRGEERLRQVAELYGLTAEEIKVDPGWLAWRQ